MRLSTGSGSGTGPTSSTKLKRETSTARGPCLCRSLNSATLAYFFHKWNELATFLKSNAMITLVHKLSNFELKRKKYLLTFLSEKFSKL
jgi:hypothetical protein